MGYIRHHAIVCTSWSLKRLEAARVRCLELGANVTEVVRGSINEYHSFMVGPDGSKEGWQESDAGDERREKIKAALREGYADGGTYIEWIEVQYGDENHDSRIVAGSDTDLAGARP